MFQFDEKSWKIPPEMAKQAAEGKGESRLDHENKEDDCFDATDTIQGLLYCSGHNSQSKNYNHA